jgi:hypothetical protein
VRGELTHEKKARKMILRFEQGTLFESIFSTIREAMPEEVMDDGKVLDLSSDLAKNAEDCYTTVEL